MLALLLSGSCYAPVPAMASTPGVAATTAPDGLGPDPADQPRRTLRLPSPEDPQRRRDADSIEASSASRYRGDAYEEQLARTRLTRPAERKLIILPELFVYGELRRHATVRHHGRSSAPAMSLEHVSCEPCCGAAF